MSTWVAAIDCGVRNMALCALDEHGTIQHWSRSDICPDIRSTPTFEQLRRGCRAWMEANHAVFANCRKVVLEVQMRKRFIALNHYIAGLLGRVEVEFLAPARLCAVFQLPRKREAKKAATQELVRARFPREYGALLGKLDDYADAALMAVYALEH